MKVTLGQYFTRAKAEREDGSRLESIEDGTNKSMSSM